MKNILTLIICFVISTSIFGQENFQYSEPFKEPEGWTKLIQIRNGNTALIEITKRDGMFLKLYGSDRKLITSGQIPLKVVGVKMGGPSSVPAIYDIGGDVVMFVLFWADGEEGLVPTLIRVIIDGKSGALKEENVLVTMNALTKELNKKMATGQIGWPNIYVEKDSNSDHYAIISYHTLTNDPSKTVGVYQFNPNHSLKQMNYIEVPQGIPYNSIGYLGSYVTSNYVIVGNLAIMSGNGGTGYGKYLITKYDTENNQITTQELAYDKFNQRGGIPKCSFVYNAVKKNITMILVNFTKNEGTTNYYEITYHAIDPLKMVIGEHQYADLTKINTYYKDILKEKRDFSGIIQGTSVKNNGDIILLFQEKTSVYTDANIPMTYFGDVGLATITPEGKTIEGFAFRSNLMVSGTFKIAFNYDYAKKGYKDSFTYQDPGLGKSWYYSMDLISTENSNYIFTNNTKENFDKPESEKSNLIKAISSTNAIQYSINNKGLNKQLLFGAPKDDKSNKFCNFTASDYNATTKTYCTIMVDVKEKKNYVVWFKLN